MSTESSSSDLRIRQIIDEYLDQKKGEAAETAEQFAARYPEIQEDLLIELRRSEMFVDVFEKTDETENTIRDSNDKRLRVICPECKSSIELEPETSWSSITCDSCKTNFSLVGTDDDLNLKSRQIGHFDLLERVGIGSFGTVWRAYDRELDRMAAIKMPRKGQLTPLESEHFLREARAAAQINHPNIVKVFEVGRVEDRVFIASEFVDGKSLAQVLTANEYSVRDSAQLVQKLAAALHHAHDVGVVHRDLKPGNILIDKNGEPHIADFGLAKRDAGDITMTKTGALMGTPAFMAPEQAKGLAHHSDARSDIYSLGVVLYRMITGELPFRGSTAALLQQVINDDPPSPRKFNDKIPRDLETICLKCLEKQPEKRYSTAAELAEEISCFLANKPIVSRPISFAERVWRWCKRKPALAAALAAAFLIFVIGTATSTVLSIEAARESRNAAAAMDTANRRIYAADMNRVQQAINRNNQIQAQGILRQYLPKSGQPDLRQIEWHYWWNKCVSGFLNQHKGNSRIFSVAVSPDGEKIVWGTDGGQLYQSNKDLSNVRELTESMDGRIEDISFSSDGDLCVTASDQGTVLIWSVPQMKVLQRRTIDGNARIWAARFWTDQNWLVLVTSSQLEHSAAANKSNDFQIELNVSNYQTGETIDSFITTGRTPWLALSQTQPIVAFGVSDRGKPFVIRNVSKQQNVCKKFPVSTDPQESSELSNDNFFGRSIFSPDSQELIVTFSDKATEKFIVVDPATGETKRETLRRKGTAGASQLIYSNDMRYLIFGTGTGGIDVYDAKSLGWIATLTGHTNRVSDITVSKSDNTIVSVADDKSIRRWKPFDLTENPIQLPQKFADKRPPQICFGADEEQVFVASDLGITKTTKSGEVSGKLDLDVLHATYSEIENALYFIPRPDDKSTTFDLYRSDVDFGSPTLVHRFQRSFSTVDCLPNGDLILCEIRSIPYSMDAPAGAVIYSIKDKKIIREFGGPKASATQHMAIYDWSISSDQKWLATCSRDRTVCVWDYQTQQLKYSKSLPDTIYPIQCVDISTNGILATGEASGNIVLRDLNSGNDLRVILAHDERVLFVKFTADGTTLISGSADSTIKIWDAGSGQLRTELSGGEAPLFEFAISSSQTHIAACDRSGKVWIWDLSPAELEQQNGD